jgi:hypothetical protein
MSKNTSNAISWSKVTIDNFDITKPEDNERIPAQKLSYIRYKNKGRVGQLYMKTPRIQSTSGGIPQEGPFYPDDQKRAKGYKIPFNKSTDEESDFYNKMKELDTWLSSEEFKRDNLGWSDKISQGYDYTPIVRQPQEYDDEEDEDEDEEKIKLRKLIKEKREKMGPRPDYMKSYFELEYQTNKVLVKVFEKNGDEKKLADDVNSLDDALKYINYMGHCKYILTPNKLYATKNKDKNGRKQYGVTWKTICVEAEPSDKSSGKEELPEDPFISDDEDDDVKITASKITKMNLKEVEEVEEIDYGTVEDESELNDQEESEEVIDVKPKVKGKVSKIVVEETMSETKTTKRPKKNSSV